MEVTTGAFAAAVDYLSTFGTRHSSVLFTPQGQSIVASLTGQYAYGEYWMTAQKPLEQRFALSMERLPMIAREIDDGDGSILRYDAQSIAMLESKGRKWWLPYVDPADVKRPEVKQLVHKESKNFRERIKVLTWRDTFLEALALAESCVGTGNNRWPDIQIQRKGKSRWMASTNGDLYALWREKEVVDEGNVSILIHHRYIPHLRAIGWSRQSLVIREGFQLLQIECGKRKAILVKSDAEFPAWPMFFDKQQPLGAGGVVVSVRDLLRVTKRMSIIGTSMTMRSSGEQLLVESKNDAGEFDDDRIALNTRVGKFHPVRVSTGYLENILAAWPSELVTIETSASERPLILISGEIKVVVATMRGQRNEESQARRKPTVAASS